MHVEFITDWKEAMNSGDTSSLERMTEDYYVAFLMVQKTSQLFSTRINFNTSNWEKGVAR